MVNGPLRAGLHDIERGAQTVDDSYSGRAIVAAKGKEWVVIGAGRVVDDIDSAAIGDAQIAIAARLAAEAHEPGLAEIDAAVAREMAELVRDGEFRPVAIDGDAAIGAVVAPDIDEEGVDLAASGDVELAGAVIADPDAARAALGGQGRADTIDIDDAGGARGLADVDTAIGGVVGAGDGDRAAGIDVDGAGARRIDIGGGEIAVRRVGGDAECVHRDRLLSDGKAARADRAAVRDRELSRAKPADDQFGALVVIPDIGAGGHGEGGADPVDGHRAVGLAPLPMIIEAPVKPCESTSKSAPAVISSRLCAAVLSGTPAT